MTESIAKLDLIRSCCACILMSLKLNETHRVKANRRQQSFEMDAMMRQSIFVVNDGKWRPPFTMYLSSLPPKSIESHFICR